MWALLLPQYSYSDYVFGHTDNAALGNSTWGMSDPLFPVDAIPGLDINGVFIRYRAVKNSGDPYTVSVQNEAADGSGYIFRETDDWTRGSGGTIQKFVPVPYSPVGRWGDGSIEQVGIGSVEDPVVMYSYRVDPDRLQQQEPAIPYDFSQVAAYDPLSDDYVLASLEPTDPRLYDDNSEERSGDDEEEDDDRLEAALAAQENALSLSSGMSQVAMLQAMNAATNLSGYYAKQLQGGTYRESVVLIDKNIPDNRRALRSLGQQKLHTDMVNQQYGR